MPFSFDQLMPRLKSYIMPWDIWSFVCGFFLQNVFTKICSGNLRALLHIGEIADEAFGQFYCKYGHHIGRREEEMPIPRLVGCCRGTVLELGACTGNQLPRFDKSKIDHVYGIEFNTVFKSTLASSIERAGLQGLYTPVWTRFEDAAPVLEHQHGVRKGDVDSIVSIQVLCSVPDAKKAVRECWEWLKPGGELVVYEHGASSDGLTRFVQGMWNLIWPPIIGCQLTRPMVEILMVEEWEVVELDVQKDPNAMLPRVSARLRKPLESQRRTRAPG